MGRGGARAKASGGSLSKDGLYANKLLSVNMTLFEFLQTGYFEKDLLSYCANRLAEYSCVYWLNPALSGQSEMVELHTMASEPVNIDSIQETGFTKYPSHFIDQKATASSTSTQLQYLLDGDPIRGTFLGPVHVRKVVLPDAGSPFAIVESNRLPLDVVARVVLPFMVVFACLANLIIIRSAFSLSRRRVPMAIYLFYLTAFDQLDLLARGTDYLIEAYGGIRLFTAIQFLGRSSCQLLPMIHSGLRHIHASILVGFAIDTCRLAYERKVFFNRFTLEWARNVLILSSTLAIIMDCQYLWTFELAHLDSKYLHERIVYNACECGISQTQNLSPFFLYTLSPLIDHIWGDVLPACVCLVCGFSSILLYRQSDRSSRFTNMGKQIEHPKGPRESVPEIVKPFAWISICQGIFILPRLIYYLTKYHMFSSHHANRGGLFWSNENLITQHPTLQAMKYIQTRITQLRSYESLLEVLESIIRYLGALNMICCAVIYVHGVEEARNSWFGLWRIFHGRLRRIGDAKTGKLATSPPDEFLRKTMKDVYQPDQTCINSTYKCEKKNKILSKSEKTTLSGRFGRKNACQMNSNNFIKLETKPSNSSKTSQVYSL